MLISIFGRFRIKVQWPLVLWTKIWYFSSLKKTKTKKMLTGFLIISISVVWGYTVHPDYYSFLSLLDSPSVTAQHYLIIWPYLGLLTCSMAVLMIKCARFWKIWSNKCEALHPGLLLARPCLTSSRCAIQTPVASPLDSPIPAASEICGLSFLKSKAWIKSMASASRTPAC